VAAVGGILVVLRKVCREFVRERLFVRERVNVVCNVTSDSRIDHWSFAAPEHDLEVPNLEKFHELVIDIGDPVRNLESS
jgi:hypothetical protein